MTRFWIDDEDEIKDEERNLITAFSEALNIARSDAGSCDRFISKCNEWCQKIQSRIMILDHDFQKFSAQVSPSISQRLLVTAFVFVCFLEFLRSMNADYFFTGVFFCFLLAFISSITAIIGFVSTTTSKSAQSVLKFRSTLIVLSKEVSLRLIGTRRKFRIISRPDLLNAISRDTYSPTLPRWNYFFRVFLLNFMSWFQISLLTFFLLVNFIIIFLFFVEVGENLRSFALALVIGDALIQYLNLRKAQDEIKYYICCLETETEKFITWFKKKPIFKTILRKYEYLKDPVLNILKCGDGLDKIKYSQSSILFTFALIKVSNGLQDVIDSKSLQNILECFFFNYSHTFSKSTTGWILCKKSDNLGEISIGSQDYEKEIFSDNYRKTSLSTKTETIKENVITNAKEYKYKFIINFLFILISALNNNFTVGSTELSDEDSVKEKSTNDHIETSSANNHCIKEEVDQEDKYNFIIDLLFNLLYASANIFSLDSLDLLVDDSEGGKSSNKATERSPFNKTATITEADLETKYKYVIDFLFMFFSAVTSISLGFEELKENDSDTCKSSNNQLGGGPSKKSSTEKEQDQKTKYNFIINFLFCFFYRLTKIFSLDSNGLTVDDSEAKNPEIFRIGKSYPEKYAINETDNETKYEYIIDFLFMFFSALTDISLDSEGLLKNDSDTEKSSNNNFGGGLYDKCSTVKKIDEEAKYNLIMECLFSLFYALTDIFFSDSTDLLVDDSEGETFSNNHSGRSLSKKYVITNKADIKTKHKFTIDFMYIFILELTKIFSIGSVELLEDGSKTKKSSNKSSSFKVYNLVDEADYEAKYNFILDFFFDLFSTLTNILSLGTKELLKNDSEKEKASNNNLKRSLFQKYATTNKTDSRIKYDFIIDFLFQLCSALVRALTSRSMEILRDSVKEKTSDKISERNRSLVDQTEKETICQRLPVKNLDKIYAEQNSNKISERNRSQINQTEKETICQRLPVKNLDKIYVEEKSKLKEKTSTTKAKVAISNPSEWSVKDPVKEKISINKIKRRVKQKNATVKEVDNKIKHKLIIDLLFKAFSILTDIFSLISRELRIKESIKEKSLNNPLKSEKRSTADKPVCRTELQKKVVNKTYVEQNIKRQEKTFFSIQSSAFTSESLKLPMNVMPLDSIYKRNLVKTPVKAVHHKTVVQASSVEGLFKRHVEQNRERKEQSSVSLFEPSKLLIDAPIQEKPLYSSFERNTVKSYEPSKLLIDAPIQEKPLYSSFERIPSMSYATENSTDDLIDSLVFPVVPNTLVSEPLGFETKKKESKKTSKKYKKSERVALLA